MEPNVSYIVLDGYMDVEKHRALYFTVFLSAFVVIVFSNCTVICLILTRKNLREPMYCFIAALLLNSVVFSAAFYPKILSDVLSEEQVVTYPTCLFQWFFLYAVAGSEFWLLTAMAIDRYVAICEPLRYRTVMTKSRVRVLLAVAWTVPALQVATFAVDSQKKLCRFIFRGIICNSSVFKLHCVQSNALKTWGMLGSVNLIFLPVLFNCFTYVRIFLVANRRGPEVRRKAARTCLPHLVVLFNYFYLAVFDVSLSRAEGDVPKLARFLLSLQLLLYHPIFNPLVYGLQMKKISAHLRRMFCAANTTAHFNKRL